MKHVVNAVVLPLNYYVRKLSVATFAIMYHCDHQCYDYSNGHICKHIHRVHSMRLNLQADNPSEHGSVTNLDVDLSSESESDNDPLEFAESVRKTTGKCMLNSCAQISIHSLHRPNTTAKDISSSHGRVGKDHYSQKQVCVPCPASCQFFATQCNTCL